MPLEDKLEIIIEAMGVDEVQRKLDRVKKGMQDFGRSTKKVNETLKKGVIAAGALTAGMGLLFRQSSVLSSLLEVQGTLFGAIADTILASLMPAIMPLIDFIATQVVPWFEALPEPVKMFVGAMVLAVPVVGALTVGVLALTAASAPMILAVLAISAAVAAGVLIWQNWDAIVAGFHEFIAGPVIRGFQAFAEQTEAIWRPLADFFDWLWNVAVIPLFELALDYVAFWVGLFTDPVGTIQEAWGQLESFFSDLWDALAGGAGSVAAEMRNAFVGAFNAIVAGFKGAFNALAMAMETAINSFANAVNTVVNAVNQLPGVDLPLMDTIELPRLQFGGLVMEPTVALIGEAGPEAVVPLDQAGGGGEYHIHLHMDNREIARGVLETLRRDRELTLRGTL